MSEVVGAHNELHSEQGALRGEHPGRSRNPVIKVADLAWLEFDKPDLDRAEAFAHAFGLQTAARDSGEVYRASPLDDQWELYDLTTDPIESVNRWQDPALHGLRQVLRTRLKEVRAASVPERNSPWPYVRRRGEPAGLD